MSSDARHRLLWIIVAACAAGVMLRSIWKASRNSATIVAVSHHDRPEALLRASAACSGVSCTPSVDKTSNVVFTDFNCAFCSKAEPALQDFIKRISATTEVHWRYLASAVSIEAAKIALCSEARNDLFAVRSQLFESVRRRQAVPASSVQLTNGDCTSSEATAHDLSKDRRDFAALGIRGVPAIAVGRTLIVGVPTERLLDSAYAAENAARSSRRTP